MSTILVGTKNYIDYKGIACLTSNTDMVALSKYKHYREGCIMIETHLRPTLQPFFDFLAACIAPYAAPNTITAIALLFGLGAAGAIATNHLFAGIIFVLLSGLCDILDGSVARITQSSSARGAYIDLISDRMVEAAIIVGFMIQYPQYHVAYVTFFIAVLLHFSTFIAAGALFKNTSNKSMHYDRSIVERAEAFVVFLLMLVFPQYLFPMLCAFNAVVFLSGVSRFVRVIQISEHS